MQPCLTASCDVTVELYMGLASVAIECIRILVKVYRWILCVD